MKWLLPVSALVGTASASLCFWFSAGFLGFLPLLLFVPGLIAFVCMFDFRSPAVRMIGWYACVGWLFVLVLASIELIQ